MKVSKLRRFYSIILFMALVLQAFTFPLSGNNQAKAAGEDYGLPAQTKDGLIFHAWNWSFDTIRANLPDIAAAGFKAVQTSPIQGTKENTMNGSYWWLLYQPINFDIGNAQLGDRNQFKQMCDEAETYGISVIVDVVANHTANAGAGNLQYTPAYNVDSSIRNNPNFWHEARGVEDWNDRWQVTQWGIGLPDLNTSNQQLQDKIIAFLNDAISLGADGFRFDAAKHIELPSDSGASSDFWTRVLGSLTNEENLYIYGEVLQGGADAFAGYSNYINLTASNYGDNVRHAVGFNSGVNVNTANDFNANGVSPSKLVTFVETHDTYANDDSESTNMSDWQIKMGWAMIASRAQTTSLFFNRPAGSGKFAGSLGTAGDTLWQDPDVAAVNKFHNAMAGQAEFIRNQGNNIMLIERGSKGMTIVNLGGDTYINSDTNLANGTYTNQASGGGTFTVANGKITGNIGSGKIAVLYDEPVQGPMISIDKQEGDFYTNSLEVTIYYSNADGASYTLNDGTPVFIHSGDVVTIGAGAAYGTSFVLKVTATGQTGTTTKTYTFKKEDPNAALVIHYYKPSSGWGTPNIYYYDDTVTPIKEGPNWPGVAMTSEGNGWYSISIPDWTGAKVIFNSNGNQIPGAQEPGYLVTGEQWVKDGVIYSMNPDVTTPIISINKPEGVFTSENLDVTISYQAADSATYSLNGAAPVPFVSGTTVTIGTGDASGTTYSLDVVATNSTTSTSKSYSFTKLITQEESLTVHYYKPGNWGTPNIYFYDESSTPVKTGPAWPGVVMQDEGNDWYSYTISGYDQANVIFNSNGQQFPAANEPGYWITTESWIKDGVVSASEPIDDPETDITVTFNIKNATTALGQNVYIVGNIPELGNWNPANAVGPGSTSNYPTWSVSVQLPAGVTIEFKAIKKNGSNVVWESGTNRSYTVSSSNPTVEFDFRN